MGEEFKREEDLFSDANVARVAQTFSADSSQNNFSVSDKVTGSFSAPKTSDQVVISDAGAELVYNRRNRVLRAKGWDDFVHLNDALKAREAAKANIWPKPDYQALIADGMKAPIAHIVKQVYDSVAVKPAVGRKALDDAAIQTYIKALNRIEAGLMSWAMDTEAVRQWLEQNIKMVGAMIGKRVALSDLAKRERSLLDAVYPDGYKQCRDELEVAGGNKVLGALQPGYEELKRAFDAVAKSWPNKREAWEVQGFRVEPTSAGVDRHPKDKHFVLWVNEKYVRAYDSNEEATAAAAAVKPFGLFGKRGFIASYDTEQEAIDAARAATQRGRKETIGEAGTSVEEAQRVGVDRRMPGEDISAERLMVEFGFKGVNFGNWMKTPAARAEAQLHLNHAFDSFHDLAEILGIPPKAISLNGMLGIAIGAQGSGHYAAHFVPGVNEINITRTRGAGSVAHEWWHAVDHYYATLAGLATREYPYLSEHSLFGDTKPEFRMVDGRQVAVHVPRFGELRPEMVGAFRTVAGAINHRLQTQEEADAVDAVALDRARKQVKGWLDGIGTRFTGQEAEFEALKERIIAGDLGDGKVAVSKTAFLSPAVLEIRELYKAKHGTLYPLDELKNLQSWVDSVQFKLAHREEENERRKVPTKFSANAVQLDRDKGGKPYWSTVREKFARAFDAYVSDELEARGARNDYLSHTGKVDVTVPVGEERQAVNAAFRSLIGEFKVRDVERAPVLFSVPSLDSPMGMSLAAIQKEVERLRLRWRSMPSVSVVRSAKDLPFDAPAHADGAYCAGRVYVVAENIASVKQLQKVFAHECILHHSLVEMLGDYGFTKLHRAMQKAKDQGDTVVVALAENIRSRYGELPAEQETMEMIALAGEQCLDRDGNIRVGFGFMKSVFASVASWLRDLGFKVPFTYVELQGIMRDAGKWIEQEPEREIGGAAEQATVFSFAGIHAKNAPVEALKVAREMHLTGVDDRLIWRDTGWTFGFADGKPRFEIVDDQARAVIYGRTMYSIWSEMEQVDSTVNNPERFMQKYPDHPLSVEAVRHEGVRAAYETMIVADPKDAREIGEYFEHGELFEAFPNLKRIRAGRPLGLEGLVNSGNASLIPQMNFIKYSGIRGPDQFVSTTLHEMQHAIQEIEGFARGGSPNDFRDRDVTDLEVKKIRDQIFSLCEKNPDFYRDMVRANQLHGAVMEKFGTLDVNDSEPLVKEWWEAIDKRDQHPEADAWLSLRMDEQRILRSRVVETAMEQYKNLAGEVEARLTQTRAGMSEAERREAYPLDQMDVPVEDQRLRFNGRQMVCLVTVGQYSGRIVDIYDGVVVQKVGRDNEVVRHTQWRLSEKVEIGDVVDIAYERGSGMVKGRGKEIDKGR